MSFDRIQSYAKINISLYVGETKIQLKVSRNSKKYIFLLKNRRKFNLSKLSALKNKEYIKKISF